MIEGQLHRLWDSKMLPFPELQLTDGSDLIVVKTGLLNERMGGPDFRGAQVIYHGLRHIGSVEIHINSSDWYQHGHDRDKNYDDVVLHVVYNDDRPVYREGAPLPTLELKQWITDHEFSADTSIENKSSALICGSSLPRVSLSTLSQTITKALVSRLESKVSFVIEEDPEEVYYQMLVKSFGMKTNQMGFEFLTKLVTWKELECLHPTQRLLLFAGKGSVIHPDNEIQPVGIQWNYRGTRPANFPMNRIRQLGRLLSQLEMRQIFLFATGNREMSDIRKYFGAMKDLQNKPLLSKGFIDHLIINSVVPFIWWMGKYLRDAGIQEKALFVLRNLPSEKNYVNREWSRTGVNSTSAYESQGLLSIFRDRCAHKKCLSCDIGKELIGKQE